VASLEFCPKSIPLIAEVPVARIWGRFSAQQRVFSEERGSGTPLSTLVSYILKKKKIKRDMLAAPMEEIPPCCSFVSFESVLKHSLLIENLSEVFDAFCR